MNKIYFEQRKLNWWNPLVWLLIAFAYAEALVMDGVHGLVDFHDRREFLESFKYGYDEITHRVPGGFTIEK